MPDRIDDIIDSGKVITELNKVYEAMSKVASLIITINDIAKNLNFKGFKEGFDTLKQAQSKIAELNQAKADAIKKESELRAALLASKNATQELNNALLTSKNKNQELKNQIVALTLAEKQASAARRAAKADIAAEAGSINDLRTKLKALQTQWDSYGDASRRANQKVLQDLQATDKQLKALEAQTGRSQRNVGNYPQVSGLVGGVSGLLGTFGIATSAGAIAKEVFDTTVKIDSLDSALRVVSKTSQEYAINQKFLIETSERLGVSILDMSAAYKLFYAASTQAGLGAAQTRDIFSTAAGVSAKLKLSQEDTNGVLLAFSQILGKGKVQAEELRGQIGERVPGAFAIAARAIGVTQQELDKMLQKGQVIANDFLPKFSDELGRAFGVDNKTKVDGLQSSINKLSNTFTDLVRDNQSSLSIFFQMIINGATGALKGIEALIDGTAKYGNALSAFLEKSLAGKAFNRIADPFGVFRNDNGAGQALEDEKARQDRITNTIVALGNKSKADQAKIIAGFEENAKAAAAKATAIRKQTESGDSDLSKAIAAQQKLEQQAQDLIKRSNEEDKEGNLGKAILFGENANDLQIAAKKMQPQIDKLKEQTKKRFDAAVASQAYIEDLVKAAKEQYNATGTITTPTGTKPTEAELNAAARLKEQQIRADAEAQKKALQSQIDAQKDIIDNEKNGFAERMAANEEYVNLKDKLANVDAQEEKDLLEVRVGRHKANAADIKKIEGDLQYQLGQNVREGGKNITKILADNADERTKDILSDYANEKQQLEKQANDELAVVQDLYKKRRITKEQYEAEELRIANEFAIKELQAEIKAQEAILEIMKQRGLPVADQEAKIKELKNKVYDLDLKYFTDSEKQKEEIAKIQLEKRLQLEKEYSDKLKDLRQEALNFTSEIGAAFFERQKNNIQGEIDLVSQRSEAEIKAVEQSTLSTQEKADKEAAINLQAQAQKEALERRQRDIDVKAATFQKFMSLLQIGITTAESVFKIQAQAAILASNPITAALAGLAYAQIPIVIAGGALQAAAIAAKPIPRYRTGRHGGNAELGITGDGGVHEVLASPDGKQAMLTPNRDTLTYIPAGWDVHPSIDDYVKAATWGASKMPVITGDPASVDKLVRAVNDSMREHSEKISRTIEENKNEFHFHNGWDGVQFTQKKLNQRQRRIDRDIFGRF